MKTVSIHEAKTQLSRLVERAAKGESFIIAKAGKPMVRVSALNNAASIENLLRVGFLKAQIEIPDDFDRLGEGEVVEVFEQQRRLGCRSRQHRICS